MEKQNETNPTFKCSNCGAPVKYQPGTSSVFCHYCKSYSTVHTARPEKPKDDRLDRTKAVKCPRCKAVYDAGIRPDSKNCLLCDEPLYKQDFFECLHLVPSYIMPFSIEEEEFIRNVKKWQDKNRTTPNPFQKTGKISELVISRIYYPCLVPDLSTPFDPEEKENPRFEYKKTISAVLDKPFSGNTLTQLGAFDLMKFVPVQEKPTADNVQLLVCFPGDNEKKSRTGSVVFDPKPPPEICCSVYRRRKITARCGADPGVPVQL